MKRLYRAHFEFDTVILADEDYNSAERESAILEAMKDGPCPDNIIYTKINNIDDLPDKWDRNCLPYLDDNFYKYHGNTIGEILKQNEDNH